ncbi:MAG: hypothetical protein KDD37_06735 [Bdellovibrionales bacterium]|nr:hypothetical protein [Bdellovibrionales bacterium]
MKKMSTLSFIGLAVFVGMAVMFQNCSKPIQDTAGGGEDPQCVGSGCNPTPSGSINAIISMTENGSYSNEVDMDKDHYVRYTGFASATDIYACAQIFNGANPDCPPEDHRTIGQDQGFTFINGVGQKRESACQLSNCTFFSHTTYYGTSIQLEVANADFTKRIKRVYYIKPPHLSPGFNEVAVWYTYNSDGRDRIISWGQNRDSIGNKLTTYVAAGERFYSHWFNAGLPLQVCIKTFTGNSVPSTSGCDWVSPDLPVTVTSSDGKHKYNENTDGFPAGRYVTFFRNANSQTVYSHATTVIVAE